MKAFSLFILLVVTSQGFSQKTKAYELEKTYWDKGKKVLRSEGYINSNPSFSYFGTKEGEWKFYHKNGKLQELSYFNRGNYVNESFQYYESGKLMIKSFFYLGVKDSGYTSYFENGNVAEIGNYKKGEKHGVWEYWYVDSSLKKVAVYDSLGNEKVASYWDKDRKQTVQEGTGVVSSFYSNGVLKSQFTYVDSVLSGPFVQNKKSNKPLTIGEYFTGKKHGTWKEYYIYYDQLKSIKTFDKDSLTGNYISYFENGKVNIEGKFENNK